MVTGASNANVAVILIDARHGVIEQTRRHAYIANLLGIPHIVVCINKMDLVDFDEAVYNKIKTDFTENISEKIEINDLHFVPVSAKLGDNVVDASDHTPWYQGKTFLDLMENIEIKHDRNYVDKRFPVQYVIRPMRDEYHDYRGYAGEVASGVFQTGDEVMALPSRLTSKIKSIHFDEEVLKEARPPQAVSLELETDIDISRGDMLVPLDNLPQISQQPELMLCWFNERKLIPRGKYVLRHTTSEVRCIVTAVHFKVDMNTLEEITDDKQVGLNDIVKVSVKTTRPLFYDSYKKNRQTGSIILVDESTNETMAAGMLL